MSTSIHVLNLLEDRLTERMPTLTAAQRDVYLLLLADVGRVRNQLVLEEVNRLEVLLQEAAPPGATPKLTIVKEPVDGS